ncbi:ABC-2 family transporter protein [Rubripirellula lacrimiformis]|uniref:ABC-2 family transporter protein n=1 Tax=Rubripirellula lacrimiformis TaxID=1930273 RepID=A0A517NG70_9BACT|nr:ABC transporter permease subunit/CPBP intramembrane protease [Rubripirellula lacrimiformis]QDT06132.1 ABC-2 family transporter protein [Rubripirellula lacrimiformis]
MSLSSEAKRRAARKAGQPRLSAVWLIYVREMRDQLRDRRTLFTIAILPILLYPLVGTLLLQIAQFTQQHETSVCIVGIDHLEQVPPLLAPESGTTFSEGLTDQNDNLKLITYHWKEAAITRDIDEKTTQWVRDGAFDVVLVIPPAFADPALRGNDESASIRLLYNVASDQSMVARDRMTRILSKWQSGWVRQRLTESGIDTQMLSPFELTDIDIAPERTRETALWSKLLPFIMLVWAMTGAFYPAIDLVAGEKERGTLETLLCSPALRSEIVWGKLGAVTTFSMLTAILNSASMLFTSSFVFHQMGVTGSTIGAPPIVPMLWLLVALVPLSALFSALALAVAAMARSSKEGQYYLMPLMMVTLPLVMLPMLPGTVLSAGTSLIPVTGMFLLVRALVEGQYMHAIWHLPMVAGVTAGCLWLSVNWVRKQFEDEAVLFGGSDQWELRGWVRHLWRDRQTAATPSQAFACGAIILVALFFGKLAVTEMPTSIEGFAKLILMPQIGMILFPALLMATMMTTSLRKSLRVRMPHWTTLPLAVLLGVTMHPMYVMLAEWISYTYPISEQAIAAMKPFTDQISAAPWLAIICLMALVPAICEEIAFRGFIFGGLVRERRYVRAVVISALMFGISHGVLQQSIAATIMGLLLGFIALRTGSVIPGILIHFTNNALSVSLERIANGSWQGASLFITSTESGPAYQPMWIVCSIGIAITCMLYFATLRPCVDESGIENYESDAEILDPSTRLATTS